MRRKDKACLDRNTIDEIIHQSEICYLSCCQDNLPYLVPLSFGYDGLTVYIHTAASGKKITIFEQNPRVCLAFVSRADLIPNKDLACDWTFEFSSVLAEGEISEITDPERKSIALNQIMDHYSDREWDLPTESLTRTRLWKIVLENPTGKKSPAPKTGSY